MGFESQFAQSRNAGFPISIVIKPTDDMFSILYSSQIFVHDYKNYTSHFLRMAGLIIIQKLYIKVYHHINNFITRGGTPKQ